MPFVILASFIGGILGFSLELLVLGLLVFGQTDEGWVKNLITFLPAPLVLTLSAWKVFSNKFKTPSLLTVGIKTFVSKFLAFFITFIFGPSLLYALGVRIFTELNFIFISLIDIVVSLILLIYFADLEIEWHQEKKW